MNFVMVFCGFVFAEGIEVVLVVLRVFVLFFC